MARATWLLGAVVALPAAATGQSLPQVGTLGAGCGATPPALTVSPPLLNSTAWLQVTPAQTGAAFVFVSFPPTLPWSLPAGCSAYVDAATAVLHGVLPAGQTAVGLQLPGDPSWLGVRLRAQAAVSPTAAPAGFDVSNGLALTLGERQGSLAGLPSPPGAHLAAVQALAAGSWLDLGAPQPDPVHGHATGREYTPRMAWSHSLQGAFLTGESGHGYVNAATGRYVDDVWFYDFAGHAWRCVKPGSVVATLSLQLNQHQFEVDGLGELVPTAQLGHGYEFVTFDEPSQRFFMQPVPNTYWVGSMPQRLGWLPNGNASFPASQYRSPWLFDTIAGRWERQPPSSPAPDFNVSARAIAAHAIDGRIWVFDTSAANRDRIWWFDPVGHVWIDEPTASSAPAISGHGISCHDAVHGRVWYYGVEAASQQAGLWFYDVALRAWTEVQVNGTPPHSSIYVTGGRGLLYDAGDDAVLLWTKGGSAPPVVHSYGVQGNAWAAPISPPAGMSSLFAWKHLNAFYAPAHDVHVFHVSGGNAGTGRIVVYRH